tara:strand:+ start:976 stop:1296 length:321 start_codon:yes stop_codon:yes gene_type:complete
VVDANMLDGSAYLSTFVFQGDSKNKQYLLTYSLFSMMMTIFSSNNNIIITIIIIYWKFVNFDASWFSTVKRFGLVGTPAGSGVLDGAAPFYRTYETKDSACQQNQS